LPPGLRAAQLVHGGATWVTDHGEPPENLVVLEVADEAELNEVLKLVVWEKLTYSVFHEPDVNDELTAVSFAFQAGQWEDTDPAAKRYLRDLPLAFKG